MPTQSHTSLKLRVLVFMQVFLLVGALFAPLSTLAADPPPSDPPPSTEQPADPTPPPSELPGPV